MTDFTGKRVLVLGLGKSGLAAAELLHRRGAGVVVADSAASPALHRNAGELRALGIDVSLGATSAPTGAFDLVVTSPGVPWENPILAEMTRRQTPIIGELELGFQCARCRNVAISGTNGKTTTTELVERVLTQNRLKTVAAGNIGLPVCAVVEQTAELDFLTLEVSSFQLETIKHFRPAVAVLMNITPDHLDRYSNMDAYIRAKGRLFMNQQPFEWAIVQSEALAMLRERGIAVPSKLISFSAANRRADLILDRGMVVSRLEDWAGPLLDMARCRILGPHNAENLMAALAVGRVLRIPLEGMVEALSTYAPAPHRCEFIAEVNGVRFINDSKATNLDALHKALLSIPAALPHEPNVWLIAGGKDKGFEYHDVGPLLSQRVKGAFLIGETRDQIRAAWGLFTPCTLADSLLEALQMAAVNAVAGDVVLLSPACSSFDQFRDYQHRGETFRQGVLELQAGATGPRGGAA